MVERKLRPAPSTLHLLPSRKPAKTGNASASKLFVLDTNVLMHDPTSLFRFEEHDIYLPMLTLEELDAQQEGRHRSRAQRAAGVALPRRAGDRACQRPEHEGIAEGIPLREKSGGAATGRLYLQTETITTHAAAVARQRQGRQPDHRRRACTSSQAHPKRHVDPGQQGHQHADQGARARPCRGGLLQRQGARGHRAPLLAACASCRPISGIGTARAWSRGSRGATRIYRVTGPLVPTLLINEFVYQEQPGESPFYAIVKEITGQDRACCRR